MSPSTQRRVHIPGLCWIPKRGTATRCTEHERHKGNHFHAYSRKSWPRYAGEKQ